MVNAAMLGARVREFVTRTAEHGGIRLLQWVARRPLQVRWRWAHLFGQSLLRDETHRELVETNLAIAFPRATPALRQWLAQRNALEMAFAMIEQVRVWQLGEAELRLAVELHNAELIHQLRGHPLVLLCPHMLGFDIAAQRLSLEAPSTCIFKPGRDGPVERFRQTARSRFNAPYLVPAGGPLLPVVRRLRQGIPMFLLPDTDPGDLPARVFTPFFGEAAATSPLAAWLALRHGALLVPLTVQRLDGADASYRVTLFAPLTDLPDNTAEATTQVNSAMERLIKANPTQYWWAQARYRTRPPGARAVYSPRVVRDA